MGPTECSLDPQHHSPKYTPWDTLIKKKKKFKKKKNEFAMAACRFEEEDERIWERRKRRRLILPFQLFKDKRTSFPQRHQPLILGRLD